MSNEVEELESITLLEKTMAKKLRLNCYKPHWRTLSNQYLLKLLKKEVVELSDAIYKERTTKEVMEECADVANFVMMIHDNAYKKGRV